MSRLAWQFCLKSCFALGCVLVASLAETASADIRVETIDGRTLVGEIDSRSNEQTIWIRYEEEQIILTTAIARENITQAEIDGEPIKLENLASSIEEQASESPFAFLAIDEQQLPRAELAPHRSLALHETIPICRIVAVETGARLVNRDPDAGPDGVEVAVAAIDEQGDYVAVEGNLLVRLWGERVHPHGSTIRFETLQEWTQPVEPKDFLDGVAVYYLRFRTMDPWLDLSLNPDCLVNVRLGVYQQGNFQATAPLCLRPLNFFRDRLQLFEGSRYFPGESNESSWQHWRSAPLGYLP